MKVRPALALTLILAAALNTALFARAGGGCLKQGTLIETPLSAAPIETLKPGDKILLPSSTVQAKIRSVYEVSAQDYIDIEAGGKKISATPEHPFMTGKGVFTSAAVLSIGATVYVEIGGRPVPAAISAISRSRSPAPAYNLLVMPGGVYYANGFIVHNKGCFLPETEVKKADGTSAPINSIRAGDSVLAFREDGSTVSAKVMETFSFDADKYYELRSGTLIIRATEEHPFYTGNGIYKTVAALKPGDTIYHFDGGRFSPLRLDSLTVINSTATVYNLHTDFPNTFFANTFAVHNKGFGGGSFHSSYHHRHSRSSTGNKTADSIMDWLPFTIIAFGIILALLRMKNTYSSGELDHCFSQAAIKQKAEKTVTLLKFIAKTDPEMDPDKLAAMAVTVFQKVQACWQERNYIPLRGMLMQDLYIRQTAQLAAMLRDGEINVMDDLKISSADLVNTRYTEKENNREFTVLFSASATDYYVDDRTRKFIRGDRTSSNFQEFWTFQRMDGKWLLRDIEQAAESGMLKEDNFFEQFTDTGVAHVYGDTASGIGPAGPQAEPEALDKLTKVDRMLNFLVKTDGMWDKKAMIRAASSAFINYYTALETADPASIPADEYTPSMLASMQNELESAKRENRTHEFRNLCIRRTELLLVRDKANNDNDEFTVRIRAHAQHITKQGGQVISQDEYVRPFEELWTFRRSGDRWQLAEILPAAQFSRILNEENSQEGASPQQIAWYYSQTRAL